MSSALLLHVFARKHMHQQAFLICVTTDCTLTLAIDLVMSRKIAVPMYFWPDCRSSPCGWGRALDAASQVDLLVLNPDSGPGTEPLETFSAKANLCRAAGQRVLGYVRSDYMKRPIAEVLHDIQKYRSWFPVDGIFVDEMYYAGIARRPSSHIPFAVRCFEHIASSTNLCRSSWS